MNLAEKSQYMRDLERHAATSGNARAFQACLFPFITALAQSLDETEKRLLRVSSVREVKIDLTDTKPSTVVVSGTWSDRVSCVNGRGGIPAFVSEMSVAADRVRNAIVKLGGREVSPRLGKFGALCQSYIDAINPYGFLAEFADGLDALSEAAEDLPEREPSPSGAPNSEAKKNAAPTLTARGRRAA